MICISIKHYLGGKLLPTNFHYNGITYAYKEFPTLDCVEKVEYDRVTFKKGTKLEYYLNENNKHELKINNIIIEFPNRIEYIEGSTYRFVHSNDSVKVKVTKLRRAINDRRASKYKNYVKEEDFDEALLIGIPLEEQLMIILEYLESRITMKHILQYEILAYCTTRDSEKISETVTSDTRTISFIHARDITTYPDRNKSISHTIPYGRIKKALSTVHLNIIPDEYDLLYSSLVEREEVSSDIYVYMNTKIQELIA